VCARDKIKKKTDFLSFGGLRRSGGFTGWLPLSASRH
jgi:hypothetical protein